MRNAAYSAFGAYLMLRKSHITACIPSSTGVRKAAESLLSRKKNSCAASRGLGLVTEVFNNDNLSTLKGDMAIGHVRYSTAGGGGIENVAPFCSDIIPGVSLGP